MIEGEFDQPLQGFEGRKVLDVQLAFALPDRVIGILQW